MCKAIDTRISQVDARRIAERLQYSCYGTTTCNLLLALHGLDRSQLNPLPAPSQVLAFTDVNVFERFCPALYHRAISLQWANCLAFA